MGPFLLSSVVVVFLLFGSRWVEGASLMSNNTIPPSRLPGPEPNDEDPPREEKRARRFKGAEFEELNELTRASPNFEP